MSDVVHVGMGASPDGDIRALSVYFAGVSGAAGVGTVLSDAETDTGVCSGARISPSAKAAAGSRVAIIHTDSASATILCAPFCNAVA
ncbi:MAG: hypothetical protein RR759_09235 [Ruthenibacterium sp.]